MAWVLICFLVCALIVQRSSRSSTRNDDGRRSILLIGDAQAWRTIATLKDASFASCDAEVFRNAIALYEWARQQRAEGFTVGAFKEGVPAKEVLLPFATPPEQPPQTPQTYH